MLVVDSDGKVSKRAIDAIDIDVSDFMTNGANNYILTATSADAMNAEANLTFDGSTLSIEADSNTTQHALYIDANSLTTHCGIYLDVNDALTATNTKSLSKIAYRKTGVIPAANTSDITGLEIVLDDDATNNGLSAVNLKGIDVKIDYDNAAGAQRPVGVKIEVAKDGTIDTLNGKGTGWETTVNNGGLDFKCYSSANDHVLTGDWSSWGTTANGATTITTYDHSGTDAHFEIAADGNITLDAAGDIALEAAGNDVTVDTDNFIIESATNHLPTLEIKSTYDGGDGGKLEFHKDRASTVVNDDVMGAIGWIGDNDADESITYGWIEVSALEVDDTDEAGRMKLQVAESDGSNTNVTTGLLIEGSDNATDGEVNVTIANGAASTTTVAGDLAVGGDDVTIYNAVNNGNPTISLGSSATDRLLIQSIYNTGAQTFNEARFTTYTTDSASPTHAGMFSFYVHEVEMLRLQDGGSITFGNIQSTSDGAAITAHDTTASSATQGGKLRLRSDDGAAMGDDHRLGVIEFHGAEDASNTVSTGARIQAVARDAWDASNNDADLEFYTTNGTTESKILTLDADKLATFAGQVTVTSKLTCASRTLAQTAGGGGASVGDHNGDVVYFGDTTSMTIGAVYHYNSSANWELADADDNTKSDGLLGIALGSASDTHGVLLRGMVTIDHDPGAIGDVLYLTTTAGDCSATAPSSSGNIVRIIGYQVNHSSSGNIWFNPDSTFVEIA